MTCSEETSETTFNHNSSFHHCVHFSESKATQGLSLFIVHLKRLWTNYPIYWPVHTSQLMTVTLFVKWNWKTPDIDNEEINWRYKHTKQTKSIVTSLTNEIFLISSIFLICGVRTVSEKKRDAKPLIFSHIEYQRFKVNAVFVLYSVHSDLSLLFRPLLPNNVLTTPYVRIL